MMEQLHRGDARSASPGKRCSTGAAKNGIPAGRAEVIDVATLMARRQQRLSRVKAGPDADPPMAADTKKGPRPLVRG